MSLKIDLKHIKYLLLIVVTLNLSTSLLQAQQNTQKHLSVTQKKANFYKRLLPPISKIHKELFAQFYQVKYTMATYPNTKKIDALKDIYKVKTDEELLLALKPHPKSITLAQAAIESAWGSSRFFREANNIFGVWSSNPNDKRIAANEKRDGKRTIWLKKFDSIEDAVREYYKMMGRAKAYKKFRKYRYESDDVFKIIKGLDVYSELKEEYVIRVADIIRYNNLTKYDD